MERTNQDWGPEGPHTSDGMRDLWEMARGLDANALSDEQRAAGVRYIPIDAIEVRYDILPRAEQTADRETVDRYLDVFDQLPPITLQAATLILIDGLHRLEAAYRMEGRYHIRAVVRDVPDERLFVEAFIANAMHGRPLKLAERRTMAERLVRAFPDHPDWSNSEIGGLTGFNRHTIGDIRKRITARSSQTVVSKSSEEIERLAEPATASQSVINFDNEDDPEAAPVLLPSPQPIPNFTVPPQSLPIGPDPTKMAAGYRAALAFFRDYTPDEVAAGVKTGKPKFRQTLAEWMTWIAACDAAVDGA